MEKIKKERKKERKKVEMCATQAHTHPPFTAFANPLPISDVFSINVYRRSLSSFIQGQD